MVKRRKELSQYVEAYLTAHPCVDCGESDPIVLQFDHVRGVKVNDIRGLRRIGVGLKALMDEITKCDVRCANCHQRKTTLEQRLRSFVDTRFVPK